MKVADRHNVAIQRLKTINEKVYISCILCFKALESISFIKLFKLFKLFTSLEYGHILSGINSK